MAIRSVLSARSQQRHLKYFQVKVPKCTKQCYLSHLCQWQGYYWTKAEAVAAESYIKSMNTECCGLTDAAQSLDVSFLYCYAYDPMRPYVCEERPLEWYRRGSGFIVSDIYAIRESALKVPVDEAMLGYCDEDNIVTAGFRTNDEALVVPVTLLGAIHLSPMPVVVFMTSPPKLWYASKVVYDRIVSLVDFDTCGLYGASPFDTRVSLRFWKDGVAVASLYATDRHSYITDARRIDNGKKCSLTLAYTMLNKGAGFDKEIWVPTNANKIRLPLW